MFNYITKDVDKNPLRQIDTSKLVILINERGKNCFFAHGLKTWV